VRASTSWSLLAVAGIVAAYGSAAAGPITPTQGWSGWYAGLNAGADWGTENVAWTAAPSLGGFNPLGATDVNISSPGAARALGFTGGGQAGYNFQFQSVVVGGEVDLEYAGLNAGRSFLSTNFLNPYTQSMQTNWLNMWRGRIGVVTGPWLVYATGGLALAPVNFTDNFLGLHGVGPINSSSTSFRAGLAAGAGAEYAIMRGWSVKLEYLHVDLGTETDAAASAIFPTAIITHTHSVTENIARVGFNYHWADPGIAQAMLTK
jgi:outer membrane immunogenic protein